MPTIINQTNAQWGPFNPPGAEGSPSGEIAWVLPGVSALWRGDADNTTPVAAQEFALRETVHLLEGGARITLDTGEVVALQAGDLVIFEAGASGVWEFDFPVSKLSIFA